jgi:hypothetical protein
MIDGVMPPSLVQSEESLGEAATAQASITAKSSGH